MFINQSVFDERVLPIRSSKTLAFIAIQFGGGLGDNVSDYCKPRSLFGSLQGPFFNPRKTRPGGELPGPPGGPSGGSGGAGGVPGGFLGCFGGSQDPIWSGLVEQVCSKPLKTTA